MSDRRSFLKGLITVPALIPFLKPDEALIKLASPEEVSAVADKTVAVGLDGAFSDFDPLSFLGRAIFVQQTPGAFFEVGELTEISFHAPMDANLFWDASFSSRRAPMRISGRAVGPVHERMFR